MATNYSVRSRLPQNSYGMGGRRHNAGKIDSSKKWSLTKAEGGSILSGMLPSTLAIDEAFKKSSTENFDNIDKFTDKPTPVLYTNRPFVTINEPCDPPERNHLNQIPGSVKPSQFVPLLSQALAQLNARRGKLTRKRLLRHMRFVGRVEESSSLNNPTPIAVLRVRGLCNYHCNLVDELGNPRTPHQLRLTAGMPLYITLPATDNEGNLMDDEYCITPFDPAPQYLGSSTASISELTRAVLQFLQLAIDHVRKDGNERLVAKTIEAAENFAWTFGDNAGIYLNAASNKLLEEEKIKLQYDSRAIVKMQDVYDKLVEIVLAKIRVIGKTPSIRDDDKAATFKFPGDFETSSLEGSNAFMKLLVLRQTRPVDARNIVEQYFAPVCETPVFDHFLGIGSDLDPAVKAEQRFHRFVGHLDAGIFPPFRAIRDIQPFTADEVRREMACKRSNGSGRSDLYLGRLIMVEKDDSITVLQE